MMVVALRKHLSTRNPSGIKFAMFFVMQQKWKRPENYKKKLHCIQ